MNRVPTLELLDTFPALRYAATLQDGPARGWNLEALKKCCNAQLLTAELLNTPIRCLRQQGLAQLAEDQEPDLYSVSVLVHWGLTNPTSPLPGPPPVISDHYSQVHEDRVDMVVGDGVLNMVRNVPCVVYAIYAMIMFMGADNHSGRPLGLQAAHIHHAEGYADLMPLIQAWDEERKRRPAA